VPTDTNGIKHWDPNLYSVHQGGVGGPRPADDAKDSAIKSGKWKSEFWVFASDAKWKPYSASVEFEAIMDAVYPRPLFNLTFLGYVRPDVDAGKEGEVLVDANPYFCKYEGIPAINMKIGKNRTKCIAYADLLWEKIKA